MLLGPRLTRKLPNCTIELLLETDSEEVSADQDFQGTELSLWKVLCNYSLLTTQQDRGVTIDAR